MNSNMHFFHDPRSVAVIGASDDPEKIGGRPIKYMREFGFGGTVLPVNPRRHTVQGLRAYPSIDELPEVPDVALIAVPGQAAVDAVLSAASMGVSGAIVMSSGFGEAPGEEGGMGQRRMLAAARESGMRIVGPNSQGLANFATGAVLGFSTLFTEEPSADGPVAIVSQSGAMCSVPYGILRRRGVGVRYAHGTGNDADVSAAEIASAVLDDEEVRIVLLYLESLSDPATLIDLAEKSRQRDVPVVALVGGRSAHGSRAASSHTGALATERKVLDAFLERLGIWQVHSVRDLVASTELFLQDWKPVGSNLSVVSNSGASCVLAADAAEEYGIPLAEFQPSTVAELEQQLPSFATSRNPVDVTAALLSDSSLFGKVLPIIGADPDTDACLMSIPVAGRGYDVETFASDAAQFAATGNPIVFAIPQPSVAGVFEKKGLVVFQEESSALAALAQYFGARHRLRRARTLLPPGQGVEASASPTVLNEKESFGVLSAMGVPVVPHEFAATADAGAEAFERLGAEVVVVKGCTADATHKSELGLVRLGSKGAGAVAEAVDAISASAREHGVALDGFLLSPMVKPLHEVFLGGHRDPTFGPVVMLGAGGVNVEVLPDAVVLLAPCLPHEVREAIGRLRLAPILKSVRGGPAADVEAWVEMVVAASVAFAGPDSDLQEFDANPIFLLPEGQGAFAVDAVAVTGNPSLTR